MRPNRLIRLISISMLAMLLACSSDKGGETESADADKPAGAPGEVAATDVPRNAYFGDSHVHTGWSADAGMDGAITTPEDAYRYALGMEVTSNSGLKAARTWSAVATTLSMKRSMPTADARKLPGSPSYSS
jgi:hypothetical protein